MTIDTIVAEYKTMANNARLFDRRNEFIAVMLEAEAARFEALKQRKPVTTGANNWRFPLDSWYAAYALAERIVAKIDPDSRGDVNFYQIAEPGYDQNIGVFANWNKYPKWLAAIEKLERLGCPISAEWSDEWVDCHECGKAYRSQPDCYAWTKSWWYGPDDCEIICADCTRKNTLDEYLEWLTESHERADLFLNDSDLEDAGWRRVDYDFASGLYGGQAVSPAKIATYLHKQGADRLLFKIDSVGQFDMDFSVWVPADNTEDDDDFTAGAVARAIWNAPYSELNGPDPAEMAKQALKSIPPMPASEVGKVQYVRVNTHDGTAEVRYLTQDEFVRGVKS